MYTAALEEKTNKLFDKTSAKILIYRAIPMFLILNLH